MNSDALAVENVFWPVRMLHGLVVKRLTLLGRTGKKNPRLGEDFIKWVDEDSIIKIILNTYDYVKEYIDPNAPGGKEHIGYIVDRTGFEEFKRWALRDVTLPEIAEVMTPMYWKGITY